jgi:hemolysin activation/secretion protein
MKLIVFSIFLNTLLYATSFDEFERETRRQESIRDAQSTIANPTQFIKNESILKSETTAPVTVSDATLIKTISVKGNSLLTPFEIYYIKQPYTNKKLTNQDIFKLIQTLQLAYVKKGFTTTRVSINTNETVNSRLTLQVTEGQIGRIYTAKNSWNDKLKLRIGVNHIARLSSLKINTQLEPGFKSGETNILTSFTQVKSPWSLYASFNGSGTNEFIPSFLQITGDNLIGIFDQWQLSYSHAISLNKNSNSTTIKSSIPLKRHLFSGNVTYSQNNEVTETYSIANILNNETKKYQVSDQYTLIYLPNFNIKITPSVTFKQNESKTDDVVISSTNQTLSSLSASTQWSSFANINATLTFEKTMPWLNSQQDTATQEADSAHYEFEKWSGSIQAAKQLTLPYIGQTASNISTSFQTTSTVTQLSEHAVLGGWYSIKGYNSNPQYGEHYAILNSEQMLPLSQYPLPLAIKNLNIQLKGFLDTGFIYRKYNLSLSSEQERLAYATGAALGIGMTVFNGQFDFKIARGIAGNIKRHGFESLWSWSIQF